MTAPTAPMTRVDPAITSQKLRERSAYKIPTEAESAPRILLRMLGLSNREKSHLFGTGSRDPDSHGKEHKHHQCAHKL